MSQREQYEKKTEELIVPILDAKGFELVDVEYVKEGQDYFLRAYIDKPGGITIDDCVAVSREMNVLLDELDYVDGAYTFEVSSPGLGRPLKKPRDYERSMGEEVEIRTYKAMDGSKEFYGILKAYLQEWDFCLICLPEILKKCFILRTLLLRIPAKRVLNTNSF